MQIKRPSFQQLGAKHASSRHGTRDSVESECPTHQHAWPKNLLLPQIPYTINHEFQDVAKYISGHPRRWPAFWGAVRSSWGKAPVQPQINK